MSAFARAEAPSEPWGAGAPPGAAPVPFVAVAPSMVAVRESLEAAAAADVNVVLSGETGTGRLHSARYLHAVGPRPSAPFLCLPALAPETLERLSDPRLGDELAGGTLVLEGADEASPELQARLVARVEGWSAGEEDAERGIRVVATTLRDLLEAVGEGAFRKDLHYLLDVFPVALPPLCERLEEVPAYLEHFHGRFAPGRRVPPVPEEFLEQAFAYGWPGNLRELANLVAASAARTGGERWALPQLLPLRGSRLEFPSFQQAKREFETSYVRRLLLLTAGNVSRAAEVAGKARKDFYSLLSRNRIEPQEYRR